MTPPVRPAPVKQWRIVSMLQAYRLDHLKSHFAFWKCDNGKRIWLLRPEFCATLVDGEVLYDINGLPAVIGVDRIDDDTRGGFLAYGFEDISGYEEISTEDGKPFDKPLKKSQFVWNGQVFDRDEI